jgi:hypothetical protein
MCSVGPEISNRCLPRVVWLSGKSGLTLGIAYCGNLVQVGVGDGEALAAALRAHEQRGRVQLDNDWVASVPCALRQ